MPHTIASYRTIQRRHSEKWYPRIRNMRSFTLENYFRGTDVPGAKAGEAARHLVDRLDCRMQISADGRHGRIRAHGNHWVEFDIAPESS